MLKGVMTKFLMTNFTAFEEVATSARLKFAWRVDYARIQKTFHVCFIFSVLCSPPASLALPPERIFSLIGDSVAQLETLNDSKERVGLYSATQVDGQRFVSVCDVLDAAHSIRLLRNAQSYEGKIVARDRERNLCLVAVPETKSIPLTIRPQAPVVGARVFAISNALGLGVGITEGVVSGIRHFPGGDYIQMTAPVSPGSQGGALVNESGQLIGILDYQRRDGQNVNFAASAGWISEIERRSAENAEQLGRFDRATTLLRQEKWAELAAASAEWIRAKRNSADAWRFSVAAAKGLQDHGAELSAWKELYQIDPSRPDVGAGLGMAMLAGSSSKEALVFADKLVAEHREYANAHLVLARARYMNGLLAQSESAYREAIELDPWLLDAYRGLAVLAQARGDTASAVSIWSRLSGLYPDSRQPILSLVHAYLTSGNPAKAYIALDRIHDDEDALVWYLKGETLWRLGLPTSAVEAYRKSLEKRLSDADWAWVGIARAMAEMRRFPEAIAAFESARKANPENDQWRYELAVSLKDGGRPQEALNITTSLIQKSPGSAPYWRQHGFVLAVLGRGEDAIPAMERSLQLDPKQPKLWRALIEVNQTVARRQQARDAYQKLRAIDSEAAEKAYRASILPYEGSVQ